MPITRRDHSCDTLDDHCARGIIRHHSRKHHTHIPIICGTAQIPLHTGHRKGQITELTLHYHLIHFNTTLSWRIYYEKNTRSLFERYRGSLCFCRLPSIQPQRVQRIGQGRHHDLPAL